MIGQKLAKPHAFMSDAEVDAYNQRVDELIAMTPVHVSPSTFTGSTPVSSRSSWGSVAASVSGLFGTLAPFLPGQYGIAAGIVSGVLAAVATKLP